jgi:hypothetical protein
VVGDLVKRPARTKVPLLSKRLSALALLIGSTSLAVPALLPDTSGGHRREESTGAPLARATSSATPAAAPQTPDATSTTTTPAATRSPVRKRTRPRFRPIRIDAADPRNGQYDTAIIKCPTCVSGSRVQYVGQTHAVVFRIRDVPVGGRRTMTIYYETQGPRPLDIVVNDDPKISLTLPGADSWIVPARTKVRIDLPAGDSDIRFFHAEHPAPDLDQIRIS